MFFTFSYQIYILLWNIFFIMLAIYFYTIYSKRTKAVKNKIYWFYSIPYLTDSSSKIFILLCSPLVFRELMFGIIINSIFLLDILTIMIKGITISDTSLAFLFKLFRLIRNFMTILGFVLCYVVYLILNIVLFFGEISFYIRFFALLNSFLLIYTFFNLEILYIKESWNFIWNDRYSFLIKKD